ncbi:MAG: TIGR00730 family Rossman fold protein [Planctomycetia bacterium]|nr:TIGR00730 family Rossman fold protein [Planctomycetia bacterium]
MSLYNRDDNLPTSLDLMSSPSFRLAYHDPDLMNQPELRSVRLMMEAIKPELIFDEMEIDSTIVVFGSARISDPETAKRHLDVAKMSLEERPRDRRRQKVVEHAESLLELSKYYVMTREFARLVSEECKQDARRNYVIVTGGGPGIMEAANRGAHDVNYPSIGLNIHLPREQQPNPYISPELCFQFHYFAIRKLHFLMRAKGLVVFPGGFGTFDELFEALTLRQTGRMQHIPIILFGKKDYWDKIINFQGLVDSGVIDAADLDLFFEADTPQQAWDFIKRFHGE